MLLLLLLTFANACLKTVWINSVYLRFNVGTFPVNINDVLMAVGLLISLIPKGQSYFETEKPHPGLSWAIVLFLLAVASGGIGAMQNGATARQVSTTARNLFEVPVLIYLGYRLLPRPSSAVFYCYLVALAGICTSVLISTNFGGQIEDLQGGRDITTVRIVDFVSNYAGLASALIIFSLGSGAKPLFRPWVAVPLAAVCYIGQFATLARSDWLAMTAGVAAAIVIMPKYQWSSKLTFAVVVVPIMAVFLYLGMVGAAALSGKDVVGKMRDRVLTLLPGDHDGVPKKAWDTRLIGATQELTLWSQSPIIGRGFGIQDTQGENHGGFRHNTWTSTLAETGLFGFAAFSFLCIGQIVIGRRMVRDRLDRGSVLIGGLGVITGVHFIIHGYCTMSFNQVRWAIPLALTFGIVIRCRAMQLAMAAEYQGYLPEANELPADVLQPMLDDDGSPRVGVF